MKKKTFLNYKLKNMPYVEGIKKVHPSRNCKVTDGRNEDTERENVQEAKFL